MGPKSKISTSGGQIRPKNHVFAKILRFWGLWLLGAGQAAEVRLSKMLQNGPKCSKNAPKTVQNAPQMLQKNVPKCSKTVQKRSKTVQKTLQNAPKRSKNAPKRSKNAPKCSKTLQNGPKTVQNAPKTVQRLPTGWKLSKLVILEVYLLDHKFTRTRTREKVSDRVTIVY